MSEILIQSKITAPRLHDKIVHRERLTALLHENKDKNLIILCAPAGFGKTTLALDYLSSQKNNYAWFSIPHKGIEDTSTFFEYLIGAVNNLNPDFGNDTLEVMKQFTSSPKMMKELVYACTASFVNEFQKCFKEDALLVIDDLHYIESEKSKAGLKEFFAELLDNIPANLHLILVSRVMPDINLTALKAKRNVYVIDEYKLNFKKEETAGLLKDVYKFKFENKDIEILDENTKGWITGLHLLLQAYGEDFSKIKYEGEISYSNIFDFFAEEIFDDLNPELQEFLMVTSLMETFDDELVNSVLGITNGKELSEELIHKNLFINRINTKGKEKKNINYGYHALFREFLNRKIKNSKIEDEINSLLEKIGDSYVEYSDKLTAINYYLESKNYEKAVPLIVDEFHKVYDAGKYDILWNFLNKIPENMIEKDEYLLYQVGYLNTYTNANYEKALHYTYKAEEIFKRKNNLDYLVKCISIISTNLINTGKTKEAIAALEELFEMNLPPVNKVEIICTLSNIYSERREDKSALDLLEKASELCDTYNLDKADLYNELGHVYYYASNFEKSLYFFKKSNESEKNIYRKITDYGNIATVFSEIRNYSDALIFFNKAINLLQSAFSLDRELLVYSQYALLLQRIGDIDESTKILENLYSKAEKNKSLFNQFDIADYLFMNNFIINNKQECIKYLNLERLNAITLDINYYKNIVIEREVAFDIRYGSMSNTEEKLIKSYKYYNSINDSRQYSIIRLLTIYYLCINDKERALINLKKFLKESPFEPDDLNTERNIIDFALSSPGLAQYKDKLHIAFTEFFDRLNIEGTSEEYKQKMRIQIENLYDLKMKAFGGLEFISRGEAITESKWKKKKGKSILAYMMLNPKAKYNKDKIIDMFFPDSNPNTVEDSFKQAIFTIRSTFKNPYLNFLLLEGHFLYLNPDCYFKSDAEEFNKLCTIARSAEHSREEKIKACKDAIEQYKGEFMEGNYEPWCEDLRGDFHNKFISVSELLLDLLTKEGNYEEIIIYSGKLLNHDKLNEKAYLSLIKAYVKSEKPKTARDSYTKMLKTYKEELGEDPDQKTLSKIESLLVN